MANNLTFGQRLGNFVNADAFPVALGMGAQAAMGPDQSSWQAMVGKAAADFQRSKIAAGAAEEQTRKQDQLRNMIGQLLAGKGLTEAGVPGPTSFATTTNPDGTQKFTLTGDKLMDTVGNSALSGATRSQTPSSPPPVAGVGPSQVGAPAPIAQSANPWARSLPFFLAQAGKSSGPGQNLTGLSPEQISNVSRTGLLGEQVTNESIGNIFSNLQKQGYTEYLDRLPQKAKGGLPSAQYKMGANGNWWSFNNAGQFVDTGTPFPPGLANTSGHNNGTPITFTGNDGKEHRGIAMGGKVVTDLGPIDKYRDERQVVQDAYTNITQAVQGYTDAKGNKVDPFEPSKTDIDLYHRKSNSPRAWMKVPKGNTFWTGEPTYEWKEIDLPAGYSTSKIMEIVDQRRAQGQNVTFEQIVKALVNKDARIKGAQRAVPNVVGAGH